MVAETASLVVGGDQYDELVNNILMNNYVVAIYFNSLTPISIPAGTKNSLSEDFLRAKHKSTNIPTMMEPFSSPAAWFLWTSVPHPREPTRKGLDKAVVEGFKIKL